MIEEIESKKSVKENSSRENGTNLSNVRWALVSLALSMLLSSLAISIANVALPTFQQAFSASFQDVQWVVLAYLLAITIMIVSVGNIGDLLGLRRVVLSGILLFTLASILCGLAPFLWILISGRVLQGIGAAILISLTIAYVRETVPKGKTGSAMGLLGTMSAVGTCLGLSVGGVLISGFGWRSIFFVLVPFSILNFILAYRYLPATVQNAEFEWSEFDRIGTLLLTITLTLYALAMTVGGREFGPLNIASLIAASIVGVVFLMVESRVESPMIQLAFFRNIEFSSSLIMNALVSTVIMSTLIVGPFYLSIALGLNETLIGIVMAVGPVLSAISGVPAGRLVDHLGSYFVIVIGLVMMAVGSFGLYFIPLSFGTVGYLSAIAIMTPGYQLFLAANNTAVMIDASASQRGIISGMLNLSRNLGLISGTSVMGAVFVFAAGTVNMTAAEPHTIATGMQITFALAGGLIVLALIFSFAGYSNHLKPEKS